MTTKYKTVWISDVHLGTKGCRADMLHDFLKSFHCDTLYLVGDIIDGWRMRKNIYFPQSHVDVVRKVLSKATHGTRVIYVTGNHDEFLRLYADFDLRFGNVAVVDKAAHTTVDGRQFLVIHGDAFDGITRYAKWLALLGDAAYEFALFTNRIYNKIRAHFGMGYWSLSAFLKNKVKKAVDFICHFEDALARECHKQGYDGVICGHIHHAEIKQISDVTYANCGDWVESCTALVEDFEGNISIVNWTNQSGVV